MSAVTRELDILKQLFQSLPDSEKRQFLASVSQKIEIKKVVEPKKNHLLSALPICTFCQKRQKMRKSNVSLSERRL